MKKLTPAAIGALTLAATLALALSAQAGDREIDQDAFVADCNDNGWVDVPDGTELEVEKDDDDADPGVIDHKDGTVLALDQWPSRANQMVSSIDVHETFEDIEGVRIWTGRVAKLRFESRKDRLQMIGKHRQVSAFEPDVVNNNQRSVTVCSSTR